MDITTYRNIIGQPACKKARAYHNGILRGGWVIDGKFYYCGKKPMEVDVGKTKGLAVHKKVTPIADCKAGTFTATNGLQVYVYENPKLVPNGPVQSTSYGKTSAGEVFNPDFLVKGDHWK